MYFTASVWCDFKAGGISAVHVWIENNCSGDNKGLRGGPERSELAKKCDAFQHLQWLKYF